MLLITWAVLHLTIQLHQREENIFITLKKEESVVFPALKFMDYEPDI